MNVILTDNDAIQAINKEYRQIDAPTDVLSFQWLIMRNLLILTMWKMQWKIISIRKQEN